MSGRIAVLHCRYVTMIEYFRNHQMQLNDEMCSELCSCNTVYYLSLETFDMYKYIGQLVSTAQLPGSSLESLSAKIVKASTHL